MCLQSSCEGNTDAEVAVFVHDLCAFSERKYRRVALLGVRSTTIQQCTPKATGEYIAFF